VLTATYSGWKDVAQGRLEATLGIMQGQIKLRGDLPTIVRYTRGAQELTACTMRLPVRWPDEAAG
jgi:putative sterol carrier protein